VAHVDGSPAVEVGVVLAAAPVDLGEWLADGAAFEAAGAGALWVGSGADGVLDPLTLTAALAAITSRSLLVTTLPASERPSSALTRTLVTVGRLSRGRFRVVADAAFPDIAEVDSAAGGGVGVFRQISGDPEVFEDGHDPAEPHQWLTVPGPESRSTWRATILGAAELGYSRLMVPANPRLLDILRNSDEPDDRRDLQLAQG
jgi:hypothetical protein